MTFRSLLALIVMTLLGWTKPAAALDISASEYALANGLRLVVIPDHRAPVVTHMIWYRVGAIDEPPRKSGLAHFLEHLMFKGTTRYPDGAFSRLVGLNGGEENAFTTQNFTAYYQRIASDRLGLVMDLEADRMQNLVLSEAIVRPERQVVQEERRERIDNDPGQLLDEQMDAALYLVHPYRKPVIGWMTEVAELTLQDAMEFYRAHYEPANAVVIVAGDVVPDEVLKLAERHYGPLRNLHAAVRAARPVEPAPLAERRLLLRDDRVSTPVFRRTYLAPDAASAGPRGDLALQILAEALGGGVRSRMNQRLVVDKRLAAYAGAWYAGDALDSGTLGIYAAPNPGVDLQRLEAEIDSILGEILRAGLTADELEATRSRLLNQSVYLLDSQFSLVQAIGTALMTGQTLDRVLEADKTIATVTLDDVNRAARQVIDRKASVTGLLLPVEEAK